MSEMNSTSSNMAKVGKEKKPEMLKWVVNIRYVPKASNEKVKPRKILRFEAENLEQLKDAAIEYLQPSWYGKDFTLTRDNIRVYYICDNEAKLVEENLELLEPEQGKMAQQQCTHDDEKKDADSSTTLIVMEYFTKVPEDLFRTVKTSQIEPATYAHPDHTNTQWTSVSPLFCASFTESEAKMPWHGCKEGKFRANGVSLYSFDPNETAADDNIDPFGPPAGKYKCVTKMTIEQWARSVKGSFEPYNMAFGILISNLAQEKESGHAFAYRKDDRFEVPEKKRGWATKNSPYFRFALKKNLDLAKYGVAVVYDNFTSVGHFTLVRTSTGPNRPWGSVGGIWLPHSFHQRYLDSKDEQQLKDLKDAIFKPCDGENAEPETFFDVREQHEVLPKVASLFAFHDLKLVASAEPAPLDHHSDDKESHLVYEGALILYHLDLGWEVLSSIDALEKTNYVVKDLDDSSRMTLLETLEVTPDIEVALDHLDWDTDRADCALIAMQQALSCQQEKVFDKDRKQQDMPPQPLQNKQHQEASKSTRQSSKVPSLSSHLATPDRDAQSASRKSSPDESASTTDTPMVEPSEKSLLGIPQAQVLLEGGFNEPMIEKDVVEMEESFDEMSLNTTEKNMEESSGD